MTMIKLDDVAKLLKVHPRTVLRGVANKVNTYWAEDHNPEVGLGKVAKAFGTDLKALIKALKDRDEFLTPAQAANFLDVPISTFRHRKYKAEIRRGNVVRYSRSDVINEHLRKH